MGPNLGPKGLPYRRSGSLTDRKRSTEVDERDRLEHTDSRVTRKLDAACERLCLEQLWSNLRSA
jgi:hypothetical protein